MSDLIKSLGNMLSVAPSTAASLVVPDPKTGIPLTGAGAQVFGFGNMLSHVLTTNPALTGLSDIEAWKQGQPRGSFNTGVGLPGNEAVEAAGQRVRQEGDRLLPPQEPTNPAEHIGQEVVRGAVSMGVPVPGIAKLGKVVETAAHILAPGAVFGKAGAVANAIGGTVGGVGAAGDELDKPAADPNNNPFSGMELAPQPIDATAQPTTPVAQQPTLAEPTTLAPQDNPFAGLQLADKPTDASGIDALVHQDGDTAWSWGQTLRYGAMLAGVFVAHKALDTAMGDAVTAAREALYNSTQQAALDAHTASGATSAPPDLAVPPRDVSPIVPDAVAQASLRARTAVVDKNAGLTAQADYYAPTADQAQLIRAQFGTHGNQGAVAAKVLRVFETGHDSDTGVRMAPLADNLIRVQSFDEPTRTLYDEARSAANELDNRKINATTTGLPADDPGTRVNFGPITNAELEAKVAAGYANPDVAFELQAMQAHYTRMTDLFVKSGLTDAQTASKFIQDHPNYMPSYDNSGTISNPFKARDMTNMSGYDSSTTPVWELDQQHLEAVLKQREQNTVKAAFLENALAGQVANPRAVKVFTQRFDANGEPVVGPNSVEYRLNGQRKVVDVGSSKTKAMLDQPVNAQSAFIKAASGVASVARSGTTQGLATLAGQPFAALNAMRTNVRIMIAAQPEMYTGMLDRGLGQLTGGKLRLQGGLDPTAYLNPVFGTARNIYGGLADARVAFLRGDDTGIGGQFRKVLRGSLGQKGYEAMTERAEIVAENSSRGMMRASGASDASGLGGRVIETARTGEAKEGYSIANAIAPELFKSQGLLGSAQAKIIRFNNFMQEISSMVGESAQTQHYALNRDNVMLQKRFPDARAQETVRAYNTRQSAGDVGQRGASPLIRDYGAISKYANVAVQDWTNLTDAMARAPFTTTMNMLTTMGIPALASIYTAMLHGPDAIDHMFNELTDSQRGSYVYFYLPGVKPEASPRIPFSQNERYIVAPMLQFLADGMISFQSGVGQGLPWAVSMLEDLFSKHITTSTADSSLQGLASATEVPVPDFIQVGAAVAGKRIKLDPIDMLSGSNRPLSQRLTAPVGSSPITGANVASDNDTNAGAITATMGWNIVSALFGAIGTGIHQDATMALQNYTVNHDPLEAASAAWQSYTQRAKNSLPVGAGSLWDAEQKLAKSTPLNNSVLDAVNALRPLLTARNDMMNEGFTRRGGPELAPVPGAQPKLPTDPTMLNMYMAAAQMGKMLISDSTAPMKQVQDIDKQLANLQLSGQKPDVIRTQSNALIRQRNEPLQRAAEFVNDLNMMLSQLAERQVDIRHIDWRKGPEQFKPQGPLSGAH